MYLAYDLLGGEHGPLRTLTRAVTYGALFGTGFGLVLGRMFGIVAGAAHGVTLAWEFSRASKNEPEPGIWFDTAMSAIRGGAYGIGTGVLFGPEFGITLAVLSTVGQVIAYRFGIRPTLDFVAGTRPHVTKRQFMAALNRTAGYAAAGYVSALLGHQRAKALSLGIETGSTIGVITAVSMICTPFVEWAADTMPAKRMGVIGVGLILTGFALQSVQYWVALLE
jgi:hypothetical protein